MRKVGAMPILLAALVLLLFGGIARGDLLSENFDTGSMPAGWTHQIISGPYDWVVQTPSLPTVAAHSGSYVALYDSWYASTGSSALLATPALNLTGYSTATLSFWMYHDTDWPSSFDHVYVSLTTDGGSTWNFLGINLYRYQGTNQWTQQTVDLSGYIGNPSVKVGFFAVSDFGNNMFIDDVGVTASGGAVPEPATLALVALGLTPLLLRRRRG